MQQQRRLFRVVAPDAGHRRVRQELCLGVDTMNGEASKRAAAHLDDQLMGYRSHTGTFQIHRHRMGADVGLDPSPGLARGEPEEQQRH